MMVETGHVIEAVERAVAGLESKGLEREYWEQNEFVVVKEFLPTPWVEALLLPQAQGVKPSLNRNYIPGHKKGGSVSHYTVQQHAPHFLELYRSASFRAFLSRLVHAPLLLCPDNDPHACALYFYTEPGDHIGFHYDTSYYKGARYTVLLGLLNRSTHCKLVCELFKNVPGKTARRLELTTEPGDLVVFNGDKLWHAVTPLAKGEERIMLTMEYVTDPEMNAFKRLYSNLKDSFGYFGLRTVFKQPFLGGKTGSRR